MQNKKITWTCYKPRLADDLELIKRHCKIDPSTIRVRPARYKSRRPMTDWVEVTALSTESEVA